MYRYLTIDEKGFVIGESYLNSKIETENQILVSGNFDYSNKKYENGQWIEAEQPAKPKSDTQKIQDNQLSIMEAMADQYEQQQEVNLNTYDVLATIYETVSGGAE